MIPEGFDAAVLKRVTAGNEKLALELIALLLSDLPAQHEQLLAASASGARDDLANVAHYLAGGAAYCGAIELKQRCVELENQLHDDKAPRVDKAVDAVFDEIRRLLTGTT